MWIPEPIYNKLPATYVGAGVVLIAVLGPNGPGLISATLLIAAGSLTALWRFKYRQPEAEVLPTPKEEWAQRKARREQQLAEMDH